MKVSAMIAQLQTIQNEHGDLDILGGHLSDDIPPRKVIVINTHGCDYADYKGTIEGVFIS